MNKVPDYLVKLFEQLGPVAAEWIEGRLAGGIDDLPEEHRETARSIIEPALARGQRVEEELDALIAKAKAEAGKS